MLTEQEAHGLYVELLEKLRDLGADELAREIGLTVARGVLRSESRGPARDLPYQTPLSATEALVVGLRIFVAALEPAFHVSHVRRALAVADGDDADGEPIVTWVFDRLSPVETPDDRLPVEADPATRGELEEMPAVDSADLTRLLEMAERLTSLLQEVEAGDP